MEVLVTFIILTSITVIASLSLSLFLDAWGRDRAGRRALPDFIDLLLLKNAIEGTYDYYVKASPKAEMLVPYFRTESSGFAFATSNPFWYEGGTALARVKLVSNGEHYALIYEESSLENKYLSLFAESVTYEHSRSIMEGIRSFSISYFGPQHFSTSGIFEEESDLRLKISRQSTYGWFADYNGSQRMMLPLKIKLVLTFDDGGQRVYLYPIRLFAFDKLYLFNPTGITASDE